jgi:hypothetical protein
MKPYVPGERLRAYRRTTASLRVRDVQEAIRQRIDQFPTQTMPAINSKLQLFVEKSDRTRHTMDLIRDAIEELHAAPSLIVLSQHRYQSLCGTKMKLQYFYNGVVVPFVSAGTNCIFDVRVYA